VAISQAAIDDLARKGAERGVDLRPGMDLVEQRLRTTVQAELPFMEDASRHLIDAGGKRFRPLLALLTGMLGGSRPTDDGLVDAAVIVELVHLSTLYHDDVIDGADVRRGAPAAHVRWSNTVAILTGDFLLARASELSAQLGVEVTRIMARTIADLCTGQIREVQGSAAGLAHARGSSLPAVVPDREHYLTVIAEKTGSLIATSCRLGALLSGQPREAVEALTAFGHHLGMSFQLADDVLDIASDHSDSGKLPGTDLREGVRTMPVLYALEADGRDSELARLIGGPAEPDGAAVDRALALLRVHPAMGLARDDARLEAAKARRALKMFETEHHPRVVLDGLGELADYAANRVG
jgi:heptaprenyl diphosphate synthase